MPIIKDVPIQCLCRGLPDVSMYGIGSIWECDNPGCRKHYVLKEHQIDGPCWVTLELVKGPNDRDPKEDPQPGDIVQPDVSIVIAVHGNMVEYSVNGVSLWTTLDRWPLVCGRGNVIHAV